ncbi:hypothetical protein BKP37_07175 [Anaerobacillus alkalilacustris]|uniref:Sulfurtransferase n=1 Tax=Anaerobacillus alkalilacustris TaxID=393763 RepID=A0A1S2LR01_9BACI|nr:YqkE family protein [Anaerobacillus alkalilacustris]OIJ14754.1 hypothetical protein BKP37_07175 [Anaerobacillus alkalilacustris]
MKKAHRNLKKQEDGKIQLTDQLNEGALSKLKLIGKQLKDEEAKKQIAKQEMERQKRIEREKNKSFEELLDESNLDWKSYK